MEWIDTDASGIYHNSSVVRFVEAAEADLARGHGLDGYFPVAPRVHYEVDFEMPLRFGQPVTASVEVERLGASSLTLAFEVWGQGSGDRAAVRAARGRYVTVHVDGQDGQARSLPWPAAWAAALDGDHTDCCW